MTTEGFMSEVRSWSAPARQLSGRPKVAGTDELNWSIFIRSKTPLYLVMTDQCASSTAIVPTLPSSLLSRFYGNSTKHFQSQSTHPKLPTGQALTKPPRAKVWSKRFPIQKKKEKKERKKKALILLYSLSQQLHHHHDYHHQQQQQQQKQLQQQKTKLRSKHMKH